jgi:hypothetical protein
VVPGGVGQSFRNLYVSFNSAINPNTRFSVVRYIFPTLTLLVRHPEGHEFTGVDSSIRHGVEGKAGRHDHRPVVIRADD